MKNIFVYFPNRHSLTRIVTVLFLTTLLLGSSSSDVLATPTGNGMLIYDEDALNATTPHSRQWTPSELGSEAQMNSDGTIVSDVNFTIVEAATTRNEYIRGSLDEFGAVNIVIYNGNFEVGSGAPQNGNFSTGIGTTNDMFRGFDIAYEATSGDAMVLYESSSTGDGHLKYRTWNGTTWSSEGDLDYSGVDEGDNVAGWIECEGDYDSNNILCAWQDITGDAIFGANWDGDSWEHISLINAAGSIETTQTFDVAWEGSGEGMVVYTTGTTNDASTYTTGGGFADTSGASGPATNDVWWINIAGSPNHDYIAVIYSEETTAGAPDLGVDMWNGSDWTTITTPAEDSDINSPGFSNGQDVAWEWGTGADRALFVWRDGTTAETSLRYMVFDISVGSFLAIDDDGAGAGTCNLTGTASNDTITDLAVAENSNGPCSVLGAWDDTVSGIQLRPDPNSRKIMLAAQDLGSSDSLNEYELQFWNGVDAGTWLTQTGSMGTIVVDGSTGNALSATVQNMPYNFAFRKSGADSTGYLFYDEDGDGNTGPPRIRSWSGTDISAESSQAEWNTVASSEANHNIVVAAPTRDEYIAGRGTNDFHLNIQIWDGDSWVFGDGAPSGGTFADLLIANQRQFDIAYEHTSGDAMVVYEDSFGNDGLIKYRTWNGTTWSSEQTIDYTAIDESANSAGWIELETRTTSGANEIMLAWDDQNNDTVFAAVWDGDSWEDVTSISTTGEATTQQFFDIAWEGTSDQGMIVYGTTTGTTTDHSVYDISVSSWADGSGTVDPTGGVNWLQLSGDVDSDYIAMMIVSGTDDLTSDAAVDMWNGTDWTTITTPADDTDINTYGYSQAVDIAWEQESSDRALFVWRDGTTSETSLRYMIFDISAGAFQAVDDNSVCTLTEGGAGTLETVTDLSAAEDSGGPCSGLGTWAGTVSGIELAADPSSTIIAVNAANQTTLDIRPEMELWNGDANGTWLTQTGTMAAYEADGSPGDLPNTSTPFKAYSFVFNQFGTISLAFTNLGASSGTTATNPDILNNADQTSYVNSSWSPPTSGLIIVFVSSHAILDHPPVIPTVSGNSLDWVLVDSVLSGLRRVSIFAAEAAGATTGATTFDFGALFTQARFQASFIQATGVELTGGVQGAFEQIQETSGTASTSGSITLNAAADSGNRPISAWFISTNDSNQIVHRTNWTEADDIRNGTPAGNFETQYRSDAFETTASASWTVSSDYVALAAEVRVEGAASPSFEQTAFRIRSDDTETINSTTGWAQALNTDASMIASSDFRIRFEVEHGTGGSQSPLFELWYSRNGGDYQFLQTNSAPHTENSAVKEYDAQTIPSVSYSDAAATTDILTGGTTSTETFVAGTGNHDSEAASITMADNRHTELEFTIMMRKLYDIRGHAPDGTTYDFQIRRNGGGMLTTYTEVPRITLANNPGHIGGAVPENPMNFMRMDDNGNIYYLTEYSDTSLTAYRSNNPVLMKSTDGGDSWNPIGEASGPVSTVHDLEGVDIDHRDDTLYITIMGPSSDSVWYYEFNTSANGTTPDTWTVVDQEVQAGVSVGNQQASIIKRSGEAVIIYRGAVVSAREQLYYEARTAGAWAGTATRLDTEASRNFRMASMVRDSADLIHVVYSAADGANGYIYNQTITTSNTLGTRTQIYTDGSLGASDEEVITTPPFIWSNGGTETVGVGFKKGTDNKLYMAHWPISDSTNVTVSSVISDGTLDQGDTTHGGSQQVIASMSVNDATDSILALYSNASDSNDLYYDTGTTGGGFGTDVQEKDAVAVHWVRTQVFTHSAGNGSATVLGYIWDNGSDGSTGHAYYDEIELAAADATFAQNHYRWYVNPSSSENVTDPWSASGVDLAEDTALTPLPFANDPPGSAQQVRLRVNITVNGNTITANTKYFKLQFRTGTDTSCSTGSWTDVGAAGGADAWVYTSETGVTDDTTLTVAKLTGTDRLETYSRVKPANTPTATSAAGEDIEFDFHIVGGTAFTNATRYLFRVVETTSDGTGTTVLDSYGAACPVAHTEPATADLMRHGNFFSGESEQGFYWAD